METVKDRARNFLGSLEKELTSNLPSPSKMRRVVLETVNSAKNDGTRKHMRTPESAFLYQYAVPIIFQHMQTVDGIGKSEALKSFLSESYLHIPDCSLATPARTKRHPFDKLVGARPANIVAQWRGERGAPLKQACPDFAFREPFPLRSCLRRNISKEAALPRAKQNWQQTSIRRSSIERCRMFHLRNSLRRGTTNSHACLRTTPLKKAV